MISGHSAGGACNNPVSISIKRPVQNSFHDLEMITILC